jgi:hypothetical protein
MRKESEDQRFKASLTVISARTSNRSGAKRRQLTHKATIILLMIGFLIIMSCGGKSTDSTDTSATTTSLAASSTSVTYGTIVTFTATVLPSAVTGAVTFYDGTTSLGSGTMSSGSAILTTTTLAMGTHTITASYGGSGTYSASTSDAVTVMVTSSDSPFGIHPASNDNYAYARDLGIKWNSEGMFFVWEWIDSGRNGKYSYTNATLSTGETFNYDQERVNLYSEDIEMALNICPFHKGGEFQSDGEKLIYQDFVEKTVKRYDGNDDLGCTLASPDCYSNGDGQYPSSDLISKFKANPIKYWQVCNKLEDTCSTDCNNTYATKYAEALKLTYEAVKEADPTANVLIAGDSKKDLYPAVYGALGGQYIDIIDFHRYGTYDWYNPKDDFNFLKGSLQVSGFDTSKLRFWITETGTYSGTPTIDTTYQYQSEKQQAEGLFKAYVSALANGIEKIFWAWGIVEGFNAACSIFDFTGLVYDGCDCVNGTYTCGTNIGYDLGSGVKKLSYYTYKKMVETLDGSDWTNIQTIQESSGVYIYKFTKNGHPIWVAWNDNINSQTISLDVGTINTVNVVEAIPKYASGSEVTNYNSAFNTELKTAQSGKITVTLSDAPVFVGETL